VPNRCVRRRYLRKLTERAVQRIIQAGAVPMTSLQFMFELQRDWGRSETYEGLHGHSQRRTAHNGIGGALREVDSWRGTPSEAG